MRKETEETKSNFETGLEMELKILKKKETMRQTLTKLMKLISKKKTLENKPIANSKLLSCKKLKVQNVKQMTRLFEGDL